MYVTEIQKFQNFATFYYFSITCFICKKKEKKLMFLCVVEFGQLYQRGDSG